MSAYVSIDTGRTRSLVGLKNDLVSWFASWFASPARPA
jgi:hypothetical protein